MSLFKKTRLEYVVNDAGPKAYPPTDVDRVVAVAWAQVRLRHSESLMVYVHGRAAGLGWDREPKESFTSPNVFGEFETRHRATVVMTHWPHWALINGFPREDAEAGAPLLASLVPRLAAARPTNLATPIVVVTHSMGGIVLATAVDAGADFSGAHTVVTSASAARRAGSATWLGKLAARVFVVANGDDSVLAKAADPGPFLGHSTADELVAAGVAAGVFYLDVTGLGLNQSHRYFVLGNTQGAPGGRLDRLHEKFFDAVYRGRKPAETDFSRPIAGQPIFRLNT
jgi:hypothetical protein